jgi:hypothetical protein
MRWSPSYSLNPSTLGVTVAVLSAQGGGDVYALLRVFGPETLLQGVTRKFGSWSVLLGNEENTELLRAVDQNNHRSFPRLLNDKRARVGDEVIVQRSGKPRCYTEHRRADSKLHNQNERWPVHDAEIVRLSPPWLFWTRGV